MYVREVRAPTCLLTVALATALTAAGTAQTSGPTAWAELGLPGGVNAAAVRGQGKLVTYDSGDALHVFSSATRRWLRVGKGPGATVRLFNDCALVLDGPQLVAVSSYFGEARKINVSPSATLWNGGAAKNDSIVLVGDNGKVHAFSAFTGAWVTRAVDASASGSVQRHVAVVHSGAEVLGMGAFDGLWHTAGVEAVHTLSTDGTAAFAVGVDVHAFSAHARAWTSATPPSGATFVRADDWGLWLSAGDSLAYSGLTGTFVTFDSFGAGVVASSDLFALLDDGSSLRAYSAVTGDLASIGAPAAAIEAGLAAAVLTGPNGARGYSALRQQVQPLAVAAASMGAGASYAHLVDAGGRLHAFSAQTATWHPAPPATAGSAPLATTTSVAVSAPGDCFAFAPGSGQFVALGGAAAGITGNPSSAPLIAYDAAALHWFDPEQRRWIPTARAGNGAPTFRIWRTTALVVDGDSAFGVGAQGSRWHRLDLGPHTASSFANSEVGYLVDANRLLACAMLPEIAALQQFPYFRRVQPRAAEVTFSAAPIEGALVVAGFAPPAAAASLPWIGELHLDLSAASFVSLTGNKAAQLRWSPPGSSALAGVRIFAQLLVLPDSGAPYLGERATVQLW